MMAARFVSIWLRHFKTDMYCRSNPALKNIPFVVVMPQHGRLVVTAASKEAQAQGVDAGMVLADARAFIPALEVMHEEEGRSTKALLALAEWFIRFSPAVAIDEPDGLLLDGTGCAHLWGGEKAYLTAMHKRLAAFGYHARPAMADTIGTAHAAARFGSRLIVPAGSQHVYLLPLPVHALRLEAETVMLLQKLGLSSIGHIINIAAASLRRRFGPALYLRLQQALGHAEEQLLPVNPPSEWQERLPCFEPVATAGGIEIALQELLQTLCSRLQKAGKGLRSLRFTCFRVDGKRECIQTGTNRPSHHVAHLFGLLQLKICHIEPALGIELFVLEAPLVEDSITRQEAIWQGNAMADESLAELLDRISGKMPHAVIHRYLGDAHYWPERSFRAAADLLETTETPWNLQRPRPVRLLARPETIEVAAPIPDYPPMLFRYKGRLHRIARADGPERIEQEWWLQDGQHRDYYTVEDEDGCRYWLFRLGHYDAERTYQWFLHGFFA